MTDHTARDFVRPFTLAHAEVHGRLISLSACLDEILGKHAYPPLVEKLLAEMLVLTAALAATLKFDGILTLQLRGDGPVSTMVADVQTNTRNGKARKNGTGKDEPPTLNIRGYAAYDAGAVARLDEDSSIPKIVGAGNLVFTLDQGPETERYQGIVALEGATLVACLTHYFAQSDQFSVALKLATKTGTGHRKGVALTLQRLPDTGGTIQKTTEEVADDWRRTVMLMGTAKDSEMLSDSLSADGLLYRLYHEEGVRVFAPARVAAQCRCSKERIFSVLKSMTDEDLDHAAEDGIIKIVCEFCAATHRFPRAGLRN